MVVVEGEGLVIVVEEGEGLSGAGPGSGLVTTREEK